LFQSLDEVKLAPELDQSLRAAGFAAEAEPEAAPSAASAGRREGETELTEIKVVDAAAAAAAVPSSSSAKVAPAPTQQPLPVPRLLAAAMVPYSAERLASGMLLMQVCPGLVRIVVDVLPRSRVCGAGCVAGDSLPASVRAASAAAE
jgi:hypothetical protein